MAQVLLVIVFVYCCYTVLFLSCLGLMTDLVMHPQMGGCSLHICYDGMCQLASFSTSELDISFCVSDTNLLLWSLRDIDGSYQVSDCSRGMGYNMDTDPCCRLRRRA